MLDDRNDFSCNEETLGELLDNFRMELVTKKNTTTVILQERERVLTGLRSDHAA